MTFFLPPSQTPISDELLSAYIDAEVTSAEKQRVEQALRTQPELGQRLAELRMTVDLLAQMETVAVPRAFVLSEAQVKTTGKWLAPTTASSIWQRLLPRLMPLATAAVAVALVVVLGLDMAGINTAPAPLQPEIAAMPVQAEPTASAQQKTEALRAQDETPSVAPAPDNLRVQALPEAESITTTAEAQAVAAAPPAQKAQVLAAPEPEQPINAPVSTLSRVEWLLGGLLLILASLTWWIRRRYPSAK